MSHTPHSPSLSEAQLASLTEVGEERTANAGDVLYRVGDRDYPFVAIIDGEVAILDAAGNEIARHGASKFLGEVNLLSGQSLFVTALATEPLRYIAVERESLRSLLFDDGPLSDLLLATFIARREAMQQVGDLGLEIVGPRSSAATVRIADHEPRSAVVSRSPRLGDPRLGLVADARYLVDDLTPSLDADALPTRAFEYGEELAVGVREAGSDLDLHGPRIRLDDA